MTCMYYSHFFCPHAHARFGARAASIIEVCRCQLRLASGLVFAAFGRKVSLFTLSLDPSWSRHRLVSLHIASSALCFFTELTIWTGQFVSNLWSKQNFLKVARPAFFTMSMRIRLSFRNQTRLSSWNQATASCSSNIFGWKAANAFWQSMECPYFIQLQHEGQSIYRSPEWLQYTPMTYKS